jgi:hypothetical protein
MLENPIIPPKDRNGRVSAALSALCLKCLSKDKRKRPATAGVFRDRLWPLLIEELKRKAKKKEAPSKGLKLLERLMALRGFEGGRGEIKSFAEEAWNRKIRVMREATAHARNSLRTCIVQKPAGLLPVFYVSRKYGYALTEEIRRPSLAQLLEGGFQPDSGRVRDFLRALGTACENARKIGLTAATDPADIFWEENPRFLPKTGAEPTCGGFLDSLGKLFAACPELLPQLRRFPPAKPVSSGEAGSWRTGGGDTVTDMIRR